MTYM